MFDEELESDGWGGVNEEPPSGFSESSFEFVGIGVAATRGARRRRRRVR